MRLLLDTHALLWWIFEDEQLSRPAHTAVADPRNDVFVSTASICEIAIKLSLNKLPTPTGFDQDLFSAIAETDFTPLPVTAEHAYRLRYLPWHHRDPFDRLLVSQSTSEGLTLVTKDPLIRRYTADCLW